MDKVKAKKSFQKLVGKVQDATQVTMAKASSGETKDIDVAVVKATNHTNVTPKEKHVRTILHTVSGGSTRMSVSYCIHALGNRLKTKPPSYLVSLKTLMVFHRLLREGGELAVDEITKLNNRENFLNLSNFKDEASAQTWDLAGWLRTYSGYLEEKLLTLQAVGFDVETEKGEGHSASRDWSKGLLLDKLPKLQQLMRRLIATTPEDRSHAQHDRVVAVALNLVVRESFKLYRSIYDGIINLLDKFFEMGREDAMKGLEVYKASQTQAAQLEAMYDKVKTLDACLMMQFPTLELPDASLVVSMEEYVEIQGGHVTGRKTPPGSPTPPSHSPPSSVSLSVPLPEASTKSAQVEKLASFSLIGDETYPTSTFSAPTSGGGGSGQFTATSNADPFGSMEFANDFAASPFPLNDALPAPPLSTPTPPSAASLPRATSAPQMDLLGGMMDLAVAPAPVDQWSSPQSKNPFTDQVPFDAPGPASPPQPKNVLDKSVLDSLYNQAPTQPSSYGGINKQHSMYSPPPSHMYSQQYGQQHNQQQAGGYGEMNNNQQTMMNQGPSSFGGYQAQHNAYGGPPRSQVMPAAMGELLGGGGMTPQQQTGGWGNVGSSPNGGSFSAAPSPQMGGQRSSPPQQVGGGVDPFQVTNPFGNQKQQPQAPQMQPNSNNPFSGSLI